MALPVIFLVYGGVKTICLQQKLLGLWIFISPRAGRIQCEISTRGSGSEPWFLSVTCSEGNSCTSVLGWWVCLMHLQPVIASHDSGSVGLGSSCKLRSIRALVCAPLCPYNTAAEDVARLSLHLSSPSSASLP